MDYNKNLLGQHLNKYKEFKNCQNLYLYNSSSTISLKYKYQKAA